MELQINPQTKVELEALSLIYNLNEVVVQWRSMEQTGTEWAPVGNAIVEVLVKDADVEPFLAKPSADQLSTIAAFINTKNQADNPVVSIQNAIEVPISPLSDGTTRIVQLYDMKVNYAVKWVKIYTRCVYSDGRAPKYVVLTADNAVQFDNGQGGTIGEYDFLFYKVNNLKEGLADVQREIIQMRSTPQGGAKWD